MNDDAPRPWLLWLWAACRALWIAVLPLAFGVVFLIAGIREARAGRWGMAAQVCGFGLIGLVLAWFAARHTWLTVTGRRAATVSSLRVEVFASAVAMTGLLLLFLMVAPYFSGMFRKSGEGALKISLIDLRARVSAYRDAHGGRAPDGLEALGPLPDLWPAHTGIPHRREAAAILVEARDARDTGKWAYVISPSSPGLTGTVFIDCTHTDTKGSAWSAY